MPHSNPTQPRPSNEPQAPPPGWVHRYRWWLIAGGFFASIAIIFGVGVYRFGWDGTTTRIVTKVLPYPAAIVDGSVIRYSDYEEALGVLERFYDAQRGTAAPGSVFPSESELKQRVMDRLIRDRLAQSLASRYGITVTSDDVRKAYDASVVAAPAGVGSNRGSAEMTAEETLDKLYGLTPAQFKDLMLSPFLVRQKLEAAVRKDDALNADKIKKAGQALDALKAGKDFRETALAYSEEPNVSATGGVVGLIGRGLLPSEVEAAAFSMQPGDVKGVIKSDLGYHVIKVTDRKMNGGKVDKVALEQIVIYPIKLDDYLDAQAKKASVIIFVH